MDKNNMKQNPILKKRLKTIGFILVILGGLCLLAGGIDFFSAFNGFGQPSLFFLFFIGIPMIGGGSACLSYAYMGEVARYTSREISPVAKDTINYMVDGTKDTIADAIKDIKGNSNSEKETICWYCGEKNDTDANFCNSCGKKLKRKCLKCGETNNANAVFCDNCGAKLD